MSDNYQDKLSTFLVSIKDDETIRKVLLEFCNLPRLERMLRLNQYLVINRIDQRHPLYKILDSLKDDQISQFVYKYLNEYDD